jgi:RimJ/RimL family protein N-acetyltransferase
MPVQHYTPTPAWEHALSQPGCPCHLLLVAQDLGAVVGWCRIFPEEHDPQVGSLGIGLLTGYRDQGLGSRMLEVSLQWASTQLMSEIRLWVHEKNQRAMQVFSKFLFEMTGARQEQYLEMFRLLDHNPISTS